MVCWCGVLTLWWCRERKKKFSDAKRLAMAVSKSNLSIEARLVRGAEQRCIECC